MKTYALTCILRKGHIIKKALHKFIICEKQTKAIYIEHEISQNRFDICFHQNLKIILKHTNKIKYLK